MIAKKCNMVFCIIEQYLMPYYRTIDALLEKVVRGISC